MRTNGDNVQSVCMHPLFKQKYIIYKHPHKTKYLYSAMVGAGGWSSMTRACVSTPAHPLFTVQCPLEATSMWWETLTQVSRMTSEFWWWWCEIRMWRLCLAVYAGTSFDYIREFRRSTGTWHRTKPMLPSDLSKTTCAALRFANCRLFRLQLSQGMFQIRVWLHCTHNSTCCFKSAFRYK